MKIVGIDPGIKGSLALADSARVLSAIVMPEHVSDVIRYLQQVEPDWVFLEKAQAAGGQGAKASFTYGKGYGELCGVMAALEIPYIEVSPKTWQKPLHKGCSGDDAKARSKDAALKLFPHINFLATPRSRKPHDGLMDAALIAEFGRRDMTLIESK